jgi:hypothetical protein
MKIQTRINTITREHTAALSISCLEMRRVIAEFFCVVFLVMAFLVYGPLRSMDVLFSLGGDLNGSGLNISLEKKTTQPTFPVFKTKRVGEVKDDDFSSFVSCRPDYLRQVEGKLARCDEIKKEAAWSSTTEEAKPLPALKYNNAETL